jgi:hypothetical protein
LLWLEGTSARDWRPFNEKPRPMGIKGRANQEVGAFSDLIPYEKFRVSIRSESGGLSRITGAGCRSWMLKYARNQQ